MMYLIAGVGTRQKHICITALIALKNHARRREIHVDLRPDRGTGKQEYKKHIKLYAHRKLVKNEKLKTNGR